MVDSKQEQIRSTFNELRHDYENWQFLIWHTMQIGVINTLTPVLDSPGLADSKNIVQYSIVQYSLVQYIGIWGGGRTFMKDGKAINFVPRPSRSGKEPRRLAERDLLLTVVGILNFKSFFYVQLYSKVPLKAVGFTESFEARIYYYIGTVYSIRTRNSRSVLGYFPSLLYSR